MKTTNLRVDAPAIRAKYETRNNERINVMIGKALRAYGLFDENVLIKLRSATFRSTGVALGESPVKFLNRQYFAMFKSNSYIASIGFDGIAGGNEGIYGSQSVINDEPKFIDSDFDEMLDTFIEAEEEVTVVLNFDFIKLPQ